MIIFFLLVMCTGLMVRRRMKRRRAQDNAWTTWDGSKMVEGVQNRGDYEEVNDTSSVVSADIRQWRSHVLPGQAL